MRLREVVAKWWPAPCGGVSMWGVTALALILSACRDVPPVWQPTAPSPIPRFEAAVAQVESEVFFFGGFKAPGPNYTLFASKRVDVFSPGTGTWERKRDMPVAVTHLNAVFDGEHVWFAGGFVGDHPGAATDAVWRYQITTDTWARGPSLPEPRAGGGLVLRDNALHYIGGFGADRDSTHATHWVLSLGAPEAGWQPRAPLAQPRGHLGVIAHRDTLYAIGGQLRHDTDPIDLPNVEAYDASTDSWHPRAPLPEGRSHFEAGIFALGFHLAIAGGRANQSEDPTRHEATDDILLYDPHADRWTTLTTLPAPLLGTAAFSLGPHLFLTGGARNAWNNPTGEGYVALMDKLERTRKQ